MHFCPADDARAICAEHRLEPQFAAPLARFIGPHVNDRRPSAACGLAMFRRFSHHVVGRNLLPLLREHDHRAVRDFLLRRRALRR